MSKAQKQKKGTNKETNKDRAIKLYNDTGLTFNNTRHLKKELIHNIHKVQKKAPISEQPRFQISPAGYYGQADVLYLPEDSKFKYALVVTDVGTREVDAEPMKGRSSSDVLDAFKTIYGRKILQLPIFGMTVDSGTEFKGVVPKWFKDNNIKIRESVVGRKRQVAIAERANRTIGSAIFRLQANEEFNTGKTNTDWTNALPKIIKAMNIQAKKTVARLKKQYSDDPLVSPKTGKLIPIGTKVRKQLDQPKGLAQGEKLHGRFRASDQRFDFLPYTVTDVIIVPNQSILYVLNENYHTVYARDQLQIIPKNENMPALKEPEKAVEKPVEKVVAKKVAKKPVEKVIEKPIVNVNTSTRGRVIKKKVIVDV